MLRTLQISTLVDFPIDNLDMSSHCQDKETKKEDCQYELFGVSNHMGGLGGGHYNGDLSFAAHLPCSSRFV